MNVRERILSIRLMEKLNADPADTKTCAAGSIREQDQGKAAGHNSAYQQEERKWI